MSFHRIARPTSEKRPSRRLATPGEPKRRGNIVPIMTFDSVGVMALPRRGGVLNREAIPETQGWQPRKRLALGPVAFSSGGVDHLFDRAVYECCRVA